MVEAIGALGDCIAIYRDQHDTPIFTNAVTRRRFASIYANVAAGMSLSRMHRGRSARGMPPNAPESEALQKITDCHVDCYNKRASPM